MSRDPYDPEEHLISEVTRVADALERIAAALEPKITGQRMMIGGHMATVIGERVIWDDDAAGVSR